MVESKPLARRAAAWSMVSVVRLMEFLIGRTRDSRRCFFEPANFPWAATLERSWPSIRAELDRVLASADAIPSFQHIQPEQRALTTDDRWKVFMFIVYGVRWQANCDRCPNTERLLRQIPGLATAMFSILGPHKHLPPHRGPYKGMLRYHLGLKVPEEQSGKCRIRVGDEVRQWHEGKSLIFDDSFDHEAWNDTDEMRVVLFVDVLRPLPFPLSIMNKFMVTIIALTPFIQRALKNLAKWENTHDQAFEGLDANNSACLAEATPRERPLSQPTRLQVARVSRMMDLLPTSCQRQTTFLRTGAAP